MPLVLEGAHPLQRDRAADVDVGRRHVDPELDAQRPAELQLRLEPALRQHVDGVAGEVGAGTTGLHYRALWRCSGTGIARAKRRRIRKLQAAGSPRRSSALLGLAAFTFGLLTAIAAQVPRARSVQPDRRRQQNTYVYASDGKRSSRSCAASQARVLVAVGGDLAAAQAGDRRDRGQALLRAPRRRRPRHPARALVGRHRRARVEGGSTITQQFVKNAINGNAPTVTRKLREAALAWKLEQSWTKD